MKNKMIKKTIIISIFILVTLFVYSFKSISKAEINATDSVNVNLTVNANSTSGRGGSLLVLPPPEEEVFIPPPENPDNLKATSEISGVDLSWSNPKIEDFSYVRIIRNEDKFRSDPFVGKLIYEGKGEDIIDKEVIPGKEYFYVLFTRTKNGNFSSGSAVSVKTFEFIKKPIKDTKFVDGKILEPETEQPELLSKDEPPIYSVRQLKQKVERLNEKKPVPVNSTQNIIIDTDQIAEEGDYLKVTGPKEETLGKYMFSFNENSGRYESVIPPLKTEGLHKITIYRYKINTPEVLDKGSLFVSYFTEEIPQKDKTCEGFECNIIEYIKYAFLLTILFLIFKITI
ncbi:MAG: hypothetical protein AAB873_00190 [Patescibacteria group bacterium]